MSKKTALITGSYGGLGTCLVNIHASQGGDLILVGRSQDKLLEQAEEVKRKYNVDAQTITADLSSPDAAQKVYDTCKENDWKVDYLINNAGFGGHGDFARGRTMEQDLSMIAVNIETPTRLCKLFLPDFIANGEGRVLNVSSTAATMPGPLQAVYFASKAFITSDADMFPIYYSTQHRNPFLKSLQQSIFDSKGTQKHGRMQYSSAFSRVLVLYRYCVIYWFLCCAYPGADS